MPALPNVPGVLKFRVTWNVEGDSSAETIHYVTYTGGPPSSAQCVTMGNAFVAAVNSTALAVMSDSSSCGNCQVTDLASSTGGQGTSTTAGTVGTRGTALLPAGAAVLVNHQIARRYRGGKPRSYMPWGISSDLQTTGLWTTGAVTAFNAAWAALVAAVLAGGSGCTLTAFANVSYYSGFTARENMGTGRWRNVPNVRATALVNAFSGSSVSTHVGSQRRRNRKA